MIIKCPETLRAIKVIARCEWCKKKGAVDPHHLFCRGIGGGSRLDVRINLIALDRNCHNLFHNGHILRADLLVVVAQRENCLQDDIEAVIGLLLRLPKEPRSERILDELKGMSKRSMEMACEILKPWLEK